MPDVKVFALLIVVSPASVTAPLHQRCIPNMIFLNEVKRNPNTSKWLKAVVALIVGCVLDAS